MRPVRDRTGVIAPEWPDHPVLDATVHDAMELGDPPQRRFHMSAMDNGTRRIVVLNAVQPVLLRNIKASERRRASGQVHGSKLNSSQRARVVEAMAAAAERWFVEELESDASLFVSEPLTQDERSERDELRLALPYSLFRARGRAANVDEDREMVAEAVVRGAHLLVSEDKSSILQEPLNNWLWENARIPEPDWIRATGKMVGALEQDGCMAAAYVWMLGAFLPSEASDRDGDDFRARIANVGEVTGMEYVVERALTEFSNDEHRVETFARVREMLPARARETEMRRDRAVRDAVNDLGFDLSR